ncbi:hypothetical protein HY003_02860 [Candidatus Saccharibacteria bacterium]|nr:hypothetical protein [Candidatus Saccharibacteria bacterium]MBI3338214.1 hypothetical protein [Candidatus Saccharibacteria bacterium]
MINLMPPDIKQQLHFARLNTKLLHWAITIFIGILGIAGVIMGGQLYIDQSIQAYNNEVGISKDRLSSQKLQETQEHVDNISNSLKLVLQVLSREVLFSKLLRQIGTVMPVGSSLQSLSINKLEGGIDLQAVASDYQTGTQVQINLQDPTNKIFEKADIQNINCTNDQATATRYPCQVSIRALFAKDNPFMFVRNSDGNTTK